MKKRASRTHEEKGIDQGIGINIVEKGIDQGIGINIVDEKKFCNNAFHYVAITMKQRKNEKN